MEGPCRARYSFWGACPPKHHSVGEDGMVVVSVGEGGVGVVMVIEGWSWLQWVVVRDGEG